MKPRHAAALALVGWYLLYPRWNAKKATLDPGLPLYRWYQVATFDSSADCEARKMKVLEDPDNHTHARDAKKIADQERLRHQARCVSADDPQLKRRSGRHYHRGLWGDGGSLVRRGVLARKPREDRKHN
jgi:hypothetical protein